MNISVIVPIYNTSSFLKKCLRSILSQSYRNIELILVNDASTDNSLEICKEFVRNDSRVKLIDKSINEGVDRARFDGLKIACGEYVMFVDSDDWLSSNSVLSAMVQKAIETDADYVEIGMNRVFDANGLVHKVGHRNILGLIEMPELFDRYYISFFGVNYLSVNIWGKLYKRSLIDNSRCAPSNLSMGEDLFFNMHIFPYLKRIYIMDAYGYNYRYGGITSRYNYHLLPDQKRLYYAKKTYISKYQYDKAEDYVRIELKNVLRSDICQRMSYKIGTYDELKHYIANELSDPIYQDLAEVKNHPSYYEEPFVKAILNRDYDSIIELCKDIVDSSKWKNKLKSILFVVLNHLS